MISMDQRVGFRSRFFASLLDLLLMGALTIVLEVLAGGLFGLVGSLIGGGPGDPARGRRRRQPRRCRGHRADVHAGRSRLYVGGQR